MSLSNISLVIKIIIREIEALMREVEQFKEANKEYQKNNERVRICIHSFV